MNISATIKYWYWVALGTLLFPSVVLAQAGTLDAAKAEAAGTPLGNIIVTIGGLVGLAIPVVVALALLFFFWGLAMYIFNTGNDEARRKGIQIMTWGIIALFVMISIWGIVAALNETFDIQSGGGPGGGLF